MEWIDFILYVIGTLFSGAIGGYVVHKLEIIKAQKELTFSERLNAYKRIMELLEQVWLGLEKNKTWEELDKDIADARDGLLLFAPDKIIKAYHAAIDEALETKKAKAFIDFFIEIRKDMVPSTEIKGEELIELKTGASKKINSL